MTFKEPVDLMSIIIHAGNSAKFVDFRRPSVLEFVFPDGSTKRVEPTDVKDAQTFDLAAGDVDHLTIRILDTNGPETAPISISEIEFFKKQLGPRRSPPVTPSASSTSAYSRRSREAAPASPPRSRAVISIRHNASW